MRAGNRQPQGGYHGKRVLDLWVLCAAALPASVIGAACAVAVKLTSPGPVFFRQQRVGRDGRPFDLLKFRSMVDAPDNPVFPHPSRITPVGEWLRRFSLDEIPQLINVARGEMSIVGPRPALAYQVARYDARQRGRLSVNPGVTGLAQVKGRNTIAWAERIEWDLEYVTRQSPWLDLKIVAETVRQLLTGRGVEGHPPDDPIAAISDENPHGSETGPGSRAAGSFEQRVERSSGGASGASGSGAGLPLDEGQLTELFAQLDQTFFRPHPMTAEEARRIAHYPGRDVYLVHEIDGQAVAYGFLRGWDEGYDVPSLGVAVRDDSQGQGYGRSMMLALHSRAEAGGASRIRLRVHPNNARARTLYESLGYREAGMERGEILMFLDLGPNDVGGEDTAGGLA